jgi:hypothetical protein
VVDIVDPGIVGVFGDNTGESSCSKMGILALAIWGEGVVPGYPVLAETA